MSIELTTEQLKAAGQGPMQVTDPETNETYVVLRGDAYWGACAVADRGRLRPPRRLSVRR